MSGLPRLSVHMIFEKKAGIPRGIELKAQVTFA